jgi:type II secretory pathway pseudopilin PulG
MVVIVIIGILSALAVPKMFGVSAKAKAAEAPGVIANWETLQSAYAQEKGAAGAFAAIGFTDPSSESKWWAYTESGISATGATITATATLDFGDCASGNTFESAFVVATDVAAHSSTGTCASSYAVNF